MTGLMRGRGKIIKLDLAKALRLAYDVLEKKAIMEGHREAEGGGLGGPVVISMYDFFTDYFYRRCVGGEREGGGGRPLRNHG